MQEKKWIRALVKIENCSMQDISKTMKSHRWGENICKTHLIKNLYPKYMKKS